MSNQLERAVAILNKRGVVSRYRADHGYLSIVYHLTKAGLFVAEISAGVGFREHSRASMKKTCWSTALGAVSAVAIYASAATAAPVFPDPNPGNSQLFGDF